MKRISTIVLVIILCLTVSACGVSEEKSKTASIEEKPSGKNQIVDENEISKKPMKEDGVNNDVDPAAYWKEHKEDLFYGGYYALGYYMEDEYGSMSVSSEFYDSDFSFFVYIDDKSVSLSKLGETVYLLDMDGIAYKCPYGDMKQTELPILCPVPVDEFVDNMEYKTSNGDTDIFEYTVEASDTQESSTYTLYASREKGGLIRLVKDDNTSFMVVPTDVPYFTEEFFEGAEELSGADMLTKFTEETQRIVVTSLQETIDNSTNMKEE